MKTKCIVCLAIMAAIPAGCASGPNYQAVVDLERVFVRKYGSGHPVLTGIMVLGSRGSTFGTKVGTGAHIEIGKHRQRIQWGRNVFVVPGRYLEGYEDSVPIRVTARGSYTLEYDMSLARICGQNRIVIRLDGNPTASWK